MSRPSTDELLMQTAILWAQRATCSRRQVGAVLSRDTRILVQGYNGAPAGMPHCDHECSCLLVRVTPEGNADPEWEHDETCRSQQHCETAEHAERNVVAYAARWGIRTLGTTMHITCSPCVNCARVIVGCGIARVVYQVDFRTTEGLGILAAGGVHVEQMGL